MSLKYTEVEPFNLPPKGFDESGVARVQLSGGSYGGEWVFWAWAMNDNLTDDEKLVGQVNTERAPGQSDEANAAGIEWVTKACQPLGLNVNVISRYGDETTAAVILDVSREAVRTPDEQPTAAQDAVEEIQRAMRQRMGW